MVESGPQAGALYGIRGEFVRRVSARVRRRVATSTTLCVAKAVSQALPSPVHSRRGARPNWGQFTNGPRRFPCLLADVRFLHLCFPASRRQSLCGSAEHIGDVDVRICVDPQTRESAFVYCIRRCRPSPSNDVTLGSQPFEVGGFGQLWFTTAPYFHQWAP